MAFRGIFGALISEIIYHIFSRKSQKFWMLGSSGLHYFQNWSLFTSATSTFLHTRGFTDENSKNPLTKNPNPILEEWIPVTYLLHFFCWLNIIVLYVKLKFRLLRGQQLRCPTPCSLLAQCWRHCRMLGGCQTTSTKYLWSGCSISKHRVDWWCLSRDSRQTYNSEFVLETGLNVR